MKGEEAIRYWQGHEDAYQVSGLSVRKYCEREGLNHYQFEYWQRKLRSLSQKKTSLQKSGGWLPLGIVDEPPAQSCPSLTLRQGRLEIEVKPGFNTALLREVLQVVTRL